VVFLARRDDAAAPMAARLLRAVCRKAPRSPVPVVESAGLEAGAIQPAAVQAMIEWLGGEVARAAEVGEHGTANEEGGRERNGDGSVDMSTHTCRRMDALAPGMRDLVITLDEAANRAWRDCRSISGADAQATCVQWPFLGDPAHLHWPLAAIDAMAVDRRLDLDTCRRLRADLRERVYHLVSDGTLEALCEERKRLEAVLDFVQLGIVAHDTQRRILLFNQHAVEITGRHKAEVLGKDCYAVFPPRGLCGGACLQRVGGQAWSACRTYGGRVDHVDGTERRLQLSSAPLRSELGRPLGALVSFRDVTEVTTLRRQVSGVVEAEMHGMVGRAPAMREIFATIRQVADAGYPVLISGESGTGKELAARAIHRESGRKNAPFVPVNCGALPENILESELFGHVRGAFTGAIRDKKGRFELAHGGTLFLDEVGELSAAFQVKLLRVLQEGTFEPVGSEKTVSVDVRIISASNRDLRAMMRGGAFREDLYYRLAVVPLELPPLRSRGNDVDLLIDRVLAEVRAETQKTALHIDGAAREALRSYRWPGNVRELINALQFAAVTCQGQRIALDHLPPEIQGARDAALRQRGDVNGSFASSSPQSAAALNGSEAAAGQQRVSALLYRRKLSVARVTAALEQTGGNKSRAAELLGVSRATLYRFLKKVTAASSS
jgi:PAS domain S-box-containing protein